MAGEFDLADLKIEDSNLAGIGSDEDKAVRKQAAEGEPAWKGCGMEAGVEVWRVEQFKIVPWPKEEYGNFYEGDSYIVLHTSKLVKEGVEMIDRDIHFWLGLQSSVDEQGTAAYKTVELDDFFDGQCVQHREVQTHESAEFKKLFKAIHYLKGGVASGFRHVGEDGTYMPRLLLAKRVSGHMHVVQVPTERDSLNQGDAFVLDGGAKIYTWFGGESSPFEKQAANTYAENIENERSGQAKVLEADDDFWALLGGAGDVKAAAEVPALPEAKPVGEGVLYKLSDATGDLKCEEVGRGDLQKSMLDTASVYICDPGNQLMVWTGNAASDRERRTAMITATKYLRFSSMPLTTPVSMVREGQAMRAPFTKIFAN